jgi:hypothetical protein
MRLAECFIYLAEDSSLCIIRFDAEVCSGCYIVKLWMVLQSCTRAHVRVCLFYISVCRSLCLSSYLLSAYLPTYLSVCLSVCPSINPPIHIYVSSYVHVFIYTSLCLSARFYFLSLSFLSVWFPVRQVSVTVYL